MATLTKPSPAVAIFGIAGKELKSFLGNPTGYVFLTLFIALCAGAAFWPREFFDRNLADLATLNRQMPVILMLFVPAITMTLWADERRAGTDELLLTLPVRDTEVVLGKFVGAVGVLSIGLAFSLANVIVLKYLGQPDVGLMFSTFLGYWLMGTLFVAIGMIGSLLSRSGAASTPATRRCWAPSSAWSCGSVSSCPGSPGCSGRSTRRRTSPASARACCGSATSLSSSAAPPSRSI
jgi:ABC-type transport system involved in multi-copper enzyme maturation permease subunit